MLKQRIITAIILIGLLLWALFRLPLDTFAIVVAGVILIAGWEWANLASLNRALRFVFIATLGAALIGVAQYVFDMNFSAGDEDRAQRVLVVACFWWALALLWVQGYPASALLWGNRWVRGVIGLFVLVPAWLSVVILRGMEQGAWVVLFVVAVVAAADVGAYFVGKQFGRHKLAPEVSPGKSWEGFFGGMAACGLLATAVAFGLGLPMKNSILFIVGVIITGLASVLGDLSESMFKRHRGIKDSSSLLPGHGGVLDRLDSLSAALPVFTVAAIASELPKYLQDL
ncbi:phosphatidate cytidylyltransferase [Biformimicrobium ophioploci]|uniref:Phosphatidate cytidylyltransferase n=1 Tax=Biformimicrobium ophioploci TaxID=3036711 RepID=A0ABQ6LZI7_9GAMM|nr:phosphatidate cytidylyltransferase [Microbulbifer sp. NKW57]GMG87509.1 phosphatidate cytidylyltransferase [Microbulbifer sp. NKW57]